MTPKTYALKHYNNTIKILNGDDSIYTSEWFMDFGKMGSEIFNIDENLLYKITQKFKFWKWKMEFTIKNSKGDTNYLISENNRKTIYGALLDNINYTIKIQYKRRTSVYKNDVKIAEFDASFTDKNHPETIKLILLDEKDLETVFLLFSCIKIGETEQSGKALIASQKQLEINEDPWS